MFGSIITKIKSYYFGLGSSVLACLCFFHFSVIFTRLHRLPCQHLFNIITLAWREREYVRMICELMKQWNPVINTRFRCSSVMFSFITLDSCFFNKPSWWESSDILALCRPLSCSNCIHASDTPLQTHTVRYMLIDWTTLLNLVFDKSPPCTIMHASARGRSQKDQINWCCLRLAVNNWIELFCFFNFWPN